MSGTLKTPNRLNFKDKNIKFRLTLNRHSPLYLSLCHLVNENYYQGK